MRMHFRLARLYLTILTLLLFSSSALCEVELAGAKIAAEQYIERLMKHPAYPDAVTSRFDVDNAEDLNNALLLDPFINYWADLFALLRLTDAEHFIDVCELKEVVVPVEVRDKVAGYVFVHVDESSELGWKAGGGSKNTPEKAYYKVQSMRAGNPENEYHLLTLIIDEYYDYILADENGILNLIPMHMRAAMIIGSAITEDGLFETVPLSQALPLLKQKSENRKQWLDSKKK